MKKDITNKLYKNNVFCSIQCFLTYLQFIFIIYLICKYDIYQMNSFLPICILTFDSLVIFMYMTRNFSENVNKVQNFPRNLRWLNPRDISIVKWNQPKERHSISIQNCGKEKNGSVTRSVAKLSRNDLRATPDASWQIAFNLRN